jgi:hypothetical protein
VAEIEQTLQVKAEISPLKGEKIAKIAIIAGIAKIETNIAAD